MLMPDFQAHLVFFQKLGSQHPRRALDNLVRPLAVLYRLDPLGLGHHSLADFKIAQAKKKKKKKSRRMKKKKTNKTNSQYLGLFLSEKSCHLLRFGERERTDIHLSLVLVRLLVATNWNPTKTRQEEEDKHIFEAIHPNRMGFLLFFFFFTAWWLSARSVFSGRRIGTFSRDVPPTMRWTFG
jgi:hypothetical protein